MEDGEEEYEVKEILRAYTRRFGRGSRREVLVKWTGYTKPTWEPLASLEDITALDAFERRFGLVITNDGLPSRGGEVI